MRFFLWILIVVGVLSPFVLGEPVPQAEAASIWIEGEDASRHNFSPGEFVFVRPEDGGASGGQYLRLNVPQGSQARPPFYAEYEFKTPADGRYRLWISGSQQDLAVRPPFFYRVDNGPFRSLKGRPFRSPSYGEEEPWAYFGWFFADVLPLKAGRHTLRIEVREPRPQDGLFTAFIDAILLTTDKTFVPAGNHTKYSPYPTWAQRREKTEYAEYARQVETNWYRKRISQTPEGVGEETSREVRRKIMARPIPDPNAVRSAPRRFGVMMFYSLIEAGKNVEKTAEVYNLLARAGVETFRTTDSLWCRVGEKADDFKELDFQVENASRYGQTFLFMIGYPPVKYAMSPVRYSAAKPEYHDKYRRYLRNVFSRYKDRGVVGYAELGNEVDAPEVWWLNSTPKMYVNEMRMVHEELRKIDPKIKILAFGATYSRDECRNGPNEGRNFVRRCFDLGIDRYVDGYSLHYTWELCVRDFPAFFRRQMSRVGSAKPLVNTEDSGDPMPYDIIKMFARNLFLYEFESVNYYLARDWSEQGSFISRGLFDPDWNPKLRLLAYALSVDAMKHRRLVGIAEPAPGVEAYVLEWEADHRPRSPAYSVVMWRSGPEDLGATDEKDSRRAPAGNISVPGAVQAWSWRLDPIPFDKKNPLFRLQGHEPIVVFTDKLVKWKLLTPAQWLDKVRGVTSRNEAPPMPGR